MGVIHNKEAIEALKKTAASLQEQINNIDPGGGPTVTVTDITADLETLPEGATVEVACIQTYGKIVLLTIVIDNPGEASNQNIYKIPVDIVPYDQSAVMGLSDNCYLSVEDDEFYVTGEIPSDNIGIYNLMWIANPAPVTPGE